MGRELPPSGDPAVTAVFAVVGEHRDDPSRLLLLGSDGLHYEHRLPDGPTRPVEPNGDWVVDAITPPVEEIAG